MLQFQGKFRNYQKRRQYCLILQLQGEKKGQKSNQTKQAHVEYLKAMYFHETV